MKGKIRIKNIMFVAAVVIVSLFFINMSLAANTGKVIVETANLRETADEDAKKLELLSINDKVEIIEKTGDWYKVKAKGITGYLRQDLLEVSEEANKVNEVSIEEKTETTNATETEQIAESQENIQNTNTEQTSKKFITEDTKLKIVPVINATDIVEVKKDEEVNVIETMNNWVCIETETQTIRGWIIADKLKEEKTVEEKQPEQEQTEQGNQEEQAVTTKTLYVNVAKVNLRKEASTSSEVVANLTVNTAVEVISEENGWSKVKVNGKEGYISSTYLSDKKQETSRSLEKPRQSQETENTTAAPAPVSGKGNTVVETARLYLGCKYVYGGTYPEKGFDCSGFTSYIFGLHGVSLSRTAAGQYSNGVAVNRSDLQPGDLVMFGKSGINHVGIYIGGGQIIHAQNPSTGVAISTINSGYYNNNYVGARRVI